MVKRVGNTAEAAGRPSGRWQELALLALMGMETAAFAPWMHNISPAVSAVPLRRFAVAVYAILAGTCALHRLTAGLRLKASLRRGLALAGLALSAWAALRLWIDPAAARDMQALYRQPLSGIEEAPLVIPAWFWVLAFVLGLWWRGVSLAGAPVGPLAVLRAFKRGIFSLILFVFAEYAASPARPDFSAAVLFVFLVCALLALTASRVHTLARLRGGHRNPFDRRWMGAVGTAALVWAGAGLGSAVLLSGRVDFLGEVVEYLAVLIGMVLAAPVLLLLALIQPAFDALVRRIPSVEATPLPTPGAAQLPDFTSLGEAADSVPPDMRPLFLAVGGAALFLLVLWVLRRSAEHLTRPSLTGVVDAPEGETLAGGLRRRLKAWAGELRGASALSARRRKRAAERIRQVYAEFVALCAARGAARPPAATPLEFIPLAEGLLPAFQPEVRILTEAYVRVRYGELPETQAEIRAVEEAWARLREALRAMKNEKPADQAAGGGGGQPGMFG